MIEHYHLCKFKYFYKTYLIDFISLIIATGIMDIIFLVFYN